MNYTCRTARGQGHPTTVFCKISVRRSKYCLEFSITLGRLKISRLLFHSGTIFEAYLIPYDFLKFNFLHFTPQVRLFFVQKRKPKSVFYTTKFTLRILLFLFLFFRRVNCKLKRKINNLSRCFKANKETG